MPVRAGARWRPGLLGLALLLPIAAARADCLDWENPELTRDSGVLQGFPPGPIAWRSGQRHWGRAHRETEIELRWRQDGSETVQVIFAEVQDGTPRLRRDGPRLLLRIEYCEAGGLCRPTTLPYRWNPQSGRFDGASPAARQALEHDCAPGPVPPR
ncbi:hypothetical protein [Pseudoroseomonas cervicalis]|uniref:hypothetical protein n=1 Tax=Teichococcus cervicalis TaxID=204525 RepID=UPI0022F1CEB2|nr:hypothetical protein [Pseudoroseomonas cervicalis]WBV41891.1 hypothetical protein PFY06_11650 [Pseudoroseomonas cervicalis]